MIAMAALEKGMRFKGREEYLDKLEVLHKSEHYLAVNKDFDVIMNTNDQPDRLSLCDQVTAATLFTAWTLQLRGLYSSVSTRKQLRRL